MSLDLGHAVVAWRQSIEGVIAAGIGESRAFSRVEQAVAVVIQENGPARHSRLTAFARAARVAVVPDRAADFASELQGLEAAKIEAGARRAGRGFDFVIAESRS